MDELKIKANVVMLPANSESIIWKYKNKLQPLFKTSVLLPHPEYGESQHLYIISDDEIKESDLPCHIYHKGTNTMQKIDMVNVLKDANKEGKKIISATDSSLTNKKRKSSLGGTFYIDKPLPQPSRSFIEKYIEEYNKGNIITDVLVECEIACNKCNSNLFEECWSARECSRNYSENYLKPKVNSKHNTIYIHRIKDSWNREEVIEFGKLILDTFHSEGRTKSGNPRLARIKYDKWIKKNL